MNCAYHPIAVAQVRCSACARALCPACDHRIKGSPYCQDCIVAGIESLRSPGSNRADGQASAPPRVKSPVVAFFLSLVPGLGAAYNGQIIKALIHFTLTAGLWEFTDIFNSFWFGLGGLGFYLFSIYDACKSAARANAGEDLRHEDERLKQVLQERVTLWGGLLIAAGTLSILHNFFGDLSIGWLWPVLVIGAGFYLLKGSGKKHPSQPTQALPANYQPLQPLMPSITAYDPAAHDYTQAETQRLDR